MSVQCNQLLPGEVHLNPRGDRWVMDMGDLSQWAGFLLCSGSKEPNPFFCSHVGCHGSESMKNPARLAGSSSRAWGAVAADKGAPTEAAGDARSKA